MKAWTSTRYLAVDCPSSGFGVESFCEQLVCYGLVQCLYTSNDGLTSQTSQSSGLRLRHGRL